MRGMREEGHGTMREEAGERRNLDRALWFSIIQTDPRHCWKRDRRRRFTRSILSVLTLMLGLITM